MRAIEYRVLGPFEVRAGGRVVGLGGDKPRALLAILLLNRNEVVSADRLIDDLWGETPPTSAVRTLHGYVSRLRKVLGANGVSRNPVGDQALTSSDGILVTEGHGYKLEVARGELDLERFEEMAERGRDALAAGRPEQAASDLREALELWRGPPLPEFSYASFAQAAISRLEELRIAATEDRLEADLALGDARELVGELRDLVERHPLRERLRGQLMLALYRSGRRPKHSGSTRSSGAPYPSSWGSSPGQVCSSSSSRSSPATRQSISPRSTWRQMSERWAHPPRPARPCQHAVAGGLR